MPKRNTLFIAAGLLALAGVAILQIPAINDRVSWRYEVAKTYIRNVIHPVGAVPTAIPEPTNTVSPASPTAPAVTPATAFVETAIPPTPTLAPPPAQAFLNSPPYEKQTANNCGPAALSMMLHMFGWSGDQKTISDVIKPVNGDRNVSPDELAYWVQNYAGWLRM